MSCNDIDITLTQLHVKLNERLAHHQDYPREYCMPMSLTGLSELLTTGDISKQLKVGGPRNQRAIPGETVDILATFLPFFRMTKAKRPLAPFFLRIFLHCRKNGIRVPMSEEEWESGGIAKSIAEAFPDTFIPIPELDMRADNEGMSYRAFKAITQDEILEIIKAQMVKAKAFPEIYIPIPKLTIRDNNVDVDYIPFGVLTQDEVLELIKAPMVKEVEELAVAIGTETRWRIADIIDYVNNLRTKKELAEAASKQ